MATQFKILSCVKYEYTSIEANIECDGDVKCRIRFERSEYTTGIPIRSGWLRFVKNDDNDFPFDHELSVYSIFDKTSQSWRKPESSEINSSLQILQDCWDWVDNSYLKHGLELPIEAWTYSDFIEFEESHKYTVTDLNDGGVCLTSNFDQAYWVHLKSRSGSGNNVTIDNIYYFNYDEYNCEENLMDKKDALCEEVIEWTRKYPINEPVYAPFVGRISDHYSE